MTETESAIREFFDSYNDCYNRLDTPGAAAHHGTPSFVVNRGEVVRIDDVNDLSGDSQAHVRVPSVGWRRLRRRF